MDAAHESDEVDEDENTRIGIAIFPLALGSALEQLIWSNIRSVTFLLPIVVFHLAD